LKAHIPGISSTRWRRLASSLQRLASNSLDIQPASHRCLLGRRQGWRRRPFPVGRLPMSRHCMVPAVDRCTVDLLASRMPEALDYFREHGRFALREGVSLRSIREGRSNRRPVSGSTHWSTSSAFGAADRHITTPPPRRARRKRRSGPADRVVGPLPEIATLGSVA
jgi:hypothetical protein